MSDMFREKLCIQALEFKAQDYRERLILEKMLYKNYKNDCGQSVSVSREQKAEQEEKQGKQFCILDVFNDSWS